MPRGTDRWDEAIRQGRLWTPTQLRPENVLRWWDAGDIQTISAASGLATQVRDKSGRANHLAASGTEATWSASTWNGQRPALTTAGSKFYTIGTSLAYAGATGRTIFAAIQQNGTASVRTIMGGIAGSIQFRLEAAHQVRLVRTSQLGIFTSSIALATGYHVVGVQVATSLSNIITNGTFETNATDGAYTVNNIEVLRSAAAPGTEDFLGVCGEIIDLDGVLTTRPRQLVEGYMAWKWDTVSRLPASHPFKNRPPLIGD